MRSLLTCLLFVASMVLADDAPKKTADFISDFAAALPDDLNDRQKGELKRIWINGNSSFEDKRTAMDKWLKDHPVLAEHFGDYKKAMNEKVMKIEAAVDKVLTDVADAGISSTVRRLYHQALAGEKSPNAVVKEALEFSKQMSFDAKRNYVMVLGRVQKALEDLN